MSSKTILSLFLLGILYSIGIGGCGSGTPTQPPPTITSVSASCSPTSVYAGQSVQTSQCSAGVVGTGAYSSGVTWSANFGTITSGGVYTAPATVPTGGMATITATSSEDTTKSGPASVTINTAVVVSASCLPASVGQGTPSACSATLTNTTNQAVTWSTSAGTISAAGVLSTTGVAPGTQINVKATSVADPGASGPATVTVTAATITLVSVVCNPTSLQAHQSITTSQCSATVTGTGNFSNAVMWSATYGSISTAGVYTAPADIPPGGMDTVTATSIEDTTKTGQANITITVARYISLAPKYPVVSQVEAIQGPAFAVLINATGLQAADIGDVIDTTELGSSTPYKLTSADVAAGSFTVYIGIDEIPSFVQFSCSTNSNAACDPAWLAITLDQRELAENTTSPPSTAYFNPGYGIGIQEFSLTNEANEGTVTLVGTLPPAIANEEYYAIAVDGGSGTNATGAVLADVDFQAVDSNVGSATTGAILPGSKGLPTDALDSIVALNGFGYVTEPNLNAPNPGDVEQFTISKTSGLTVGTSAASGGGPYAIDAATVNSADAIVVFSADTTVRLFSNTLALESTLTAGLTNITPLGTAYNNNLAATPVIALGGWPVRIIGSGSAAGTVGVLSSYDNVLDFLTISGTNTLAWAGTTNGALTFSGNPYPYLIAPDPIHGAFIVALADTTNGVTTLERISATTHAVTAITPNPALPTGFLASGIMVSDDGNTIYVAGVFYSDATKTAKFYAVTNP